MAPKGGGGDEYTLLLPFGCLKLDRGRDVLRPHSCRLLVPNFLFQLLLQLTREILVLGSPFAVISSVAPFLFKLHGRRGRQAGPTLTPRH